jgi:hypothetical protein
MSGPGNARAAPAHGERRPADARPPGDSAEHTRSAENEAIRTHPASAQQAWDLRSNPGHVAPYNAAYFWRLAGAIDIAAAEQAIGAVERRHTVLRSRLCETRGHTIQIVEAPRSSPLVYRDLRFERGAKRWRAVIGTAKADLTRPRVLTTGVGFNPYLWRIGDAEFILGLVVAHTAFDGASIPVFLNEFMGSYAAALRDDSCSRAEELPLQAWELAQADRTDSRRSAIAAWRTRLEASARPQHALPTAPGTRRPNMVGVTPPVTLPRVVRQRLEAQARAAGMRLSAVALAAVWLLLRLCNGSHDQIVGVVYANRDRPENRAVIGCVVEVVPMPLEGSAEQTIAAMILQAGKTLRRFRANGVTMTSLFPEARGEGPWRGTPICDVTMHYRPVPKDGRAQHLADGYSAQLLDYKAVAFPTVERWDLGLAEYAVLDTPDGGLALLASYNKGAVCPDVAIASVEILREILRSMASRNSTHVSQLLAGVRRRAPTAATTIECAGRG